MNRYLPKIRSKYKRQATIPQGKSLPMKIRPSDHLEN